MSRKVVIDTGCLYRLKDDKKVLDMLNSCGCKAYDMTLFWKGTTEHIGTGEDYVNNASALKEYADSLGMACEQAHSYFQAGTDIETFNRRYDYISKDMHIASILGAKSIVIHPIPELNYEENIKYIKTFIPYAHKYDIKIAIENVWGVTDGKISATCTSTPDSFVKFLDELNDPYVVACLDIGHAELNQIGTNSVDMIHALGNRLYCLHIHDNDKWSDAHQIPYTHKIPFADILDALMKIHYQGNITFEVETCYNKGENPRAELPLELFPAFIKLQLEIGEYFINYLDK